MTVRIIEAQYQIVGERYFLVYIGRITRGNGGNVVARCRTDSNGSSLRVAGIYRMGEKEKIGEMEVEENEFKDGKKFGKRLEEFLKDEKIIPRVAQK